MTSEAEASARLQRLEQDFDLLQYQVDGWCVWPLLRFAVAAELQRLPFDGGRLAPSRAQVWKLALRDLPRMVRAPRARFVVKTFSSYHADFENGLRKDVHFDELLARLEGGRFKIESVNNRSFLEDERGYLVPSDITTFALEMLGRRLATVSGAIADAATKIARALRDGLGTPIFSAATITDVLANFRGQRRAHRWLLARVKPRQVLLADGGDFALIAAARELGIEVIELQHGFTHRHFPGNSWTAYALPYKPRMPIPQRMFLYGPHWQRELAANGFWSSELVSVGSVRMDSYRRRAATRDPDQGTLVLTTQGLGTEQIVRMLVDFVRLAAERLRFQLYIKMHPAYGTNIAAYEEPFRGLPNVHIVLSSSAPSTFDLLARAHLHLSISSTCHFEALALGVPTVVLPLPGSEIVQPLVDAGHAFTAATGRELLDLALRYRDETVSPEIGHQYFAPGALENMLRALGVADVRGYAPERATPPC